MERTPAAAAMDWSIHLDKALRSNNHGTRTEAIQEVGARLEWWSKEPELSMAEYDMFGLIPGEDKLFANAILLRLADTFVSGDKHTKLCVVKIFLSELRHRKGRSYNRKKESILSRYHVENHLELLRRIKLCFNSGDEDVRALALVLFGCWSDFAKDNSDIRYIILSSLVSCHVLEVKASLFAAGCFCEFSDDFACVVLEMLVNMVPSSDMPIAGRLAGVHAFAKLASSSTLSIRAYEEGLKLLFGSSEDDIVTSMLKSLSIIASRSALLISRQVDLLLSFLSQDKAYPLQATSLRCLCIISSRRRFRFSLPMEMFSKMVIMLNGELPAAMQCNALHILYEILMSKMLSLSRSEMHACFTEVLAVAENLMQSPFLSNRLFVMRILADISGSFTKIIDMPYDGDDKTPASQAISFVMARITLLTNSVRELNQPDMELECEVQSLLKIICLLLNQCPELGEFVLHKFHLLINGILNKDDDRTTLSKLVVHIAKVVILCLKSMEKTGGLTGQVQNVVRLLIEDICGCSYLNCYVYIVYHLLLHPHTCHDLITPDHAYLINNEILVLERAKELMAMDSWSAYKAGKYATFQGAWFTAAYIFGELRTKVRSDTFNRWLTSLALFAYSEMKIQYFSFSKERLPLLIWLNNNQSSALPVGDIGKTDKPIHVMSLHHYLENLDGVCKILQSSKEILSADGVTPSCQHYFQIQFLSLRTKAIEIAVHVFKLIDTVSFHEHSSMTDGLNELVQPLTLLSARFMKLAREYDLTATSFIGMDRKSTMIISAHGLSCSVLAFITGFSLLFVNRNAGNLGSQKIESNFHAELINGLITRLWHIDRETSKDLKLLLKTCFSQSNRCDVSQSKTQRLENTSEVKHIIKICRFAVKGIIGLQDAAKRMQANDDDIPMEIIENGLKLLLGVVSNWLISLRIPKYFFCVRPSVSCQLFAMNRDSGYGERISVKPGYYLHLDLCLQLSHISSDLRSRLTKLFCILHCKMSYPVHNQSIDDKKQTEEAQELEDDNILELNEKLVKHVNSCDESTTSKKDCSFDGQIAETIVCFRPNGKGQGFSTCILNVSMFPMGSYEIKWRAGCVDINGSYWSLNSSNSGPVFTVQKS